VAELQALVVGMLLGSLLSQDKVAIDIEVPTDDDGNYLPHFFVTGKNSGERLRVVVEREDQGG